MIKEQYKNQFDMMFLFYYCFKLDAYCKECLNQGNFASVDMKKFSKFLFPVVPLPVQREIVKILDNFTELTARKKQYEYYKNELIERVAGNRTVRLEEVCDVFDGTHQTPKYMEDGVPFVSVENIRDRLLSFKEI